MFQRSKKKYRLFSFLLKIYFLLVFYTCKKQYIIPLGSKEILTNSLQSCFLFCWHGRIAMMPVFLQKIFPKRRFVALVSHHSDGEYLSHLIARFQHQTIRGSSSKGGAQAVRNIITAIKKNQVITITPDGPRGPSMKFVSKTPSLAKKYNLPIIYSCYVASRFITMKTWDNFLLPLPFGKLTLVFSEPWYDNNNQSLEQNSIILEKLMTLQQNQLDQKNQQ